MLQPEFWFLYLVDATFVLFFVLIFVMLRKRGYPRIARNPRIIGRVLCLLALGMLVALVSVGFSGGKPQLLLLFQHRSSFGLILTLSFSLLLAGGVFYLVAVRGDGGQGKG